MLKIIFLLLACLAMLNSHSTNLRDEFTSNNIPELFKKFMTKHNKQYKNILELSIALKNFYENIKSDPQNHNKNDSEIVFTKFYDMTFQQFEETYLSGYLAGKPNVQLEEYVPNQENLKALPDAIDYRNDGFVGPVKNQGQCGSCWAFSTVATLEGVAAKKTRIFRQYSEQQLVDCDDINKGCEGGLPSNAYNYLAKKEVGGIESEEAYPYIGKDDNCKFDKSKIVLQVTGGVEIKQNEDIIKEALFNLGPLSVGLNANNLHFYHGGIINDDNKKCNQKALNHGVAIVGYGFDKPTNQKYWIIKNSWGADFGENGYFRMLRGENTCGIESAVTAPLIKVTNN